MRARGTGHRGESEVPDTPPGYEDAVEGRRCISVIGIDHYRAWDHLANAVNDACGVLGAFEDLGFERISELLDKEATADAIQCLPGDLEPQLGQNDSLVVFFAGHGHTTTTEFSDGQVSRGYLIPVDADVKKWNTWQRIGHWLRDLAELPARHILVILDSCHSGIALSSEIQYRGTGVRSNGDPMSPQQRKSRRILTSAHHSEKAMDGGPFPGHSVFTGYLIEALREGSRFWQGSAAVSMNEIAEHVRRRVREYSRGRQMPDAGHLEFDDSGELLISLRQPRAELPPGAGHGGADIDRARYFDADRRVSGKLGRRRSDKAATTGSSANTTTGRIARPLVWPETRPAAPEQPGAANRRRHPGGEAPLSSPPRSDPQSSSVRPVATKGEPRSADSRLPDRTEGWLLDATLAWSLDRQGEERRRGAPVLTVVAGDAMAAQTSWGTWAARHGYLTQATQAVGLEAVVADLLAQTPWLRCVPEARKRLAAAARIDVQAVDASLDARGGPDRHTWIDDVAAGDPHARVSGWLLSWLRRASACAPDPATAPVRPERLLAIACDLASPTAVLLFHPEPDERWLERAVVTAAQLVEYLPQHSIAVTAPDELVTCVLASRRAGAAWTMARQGLVKVEALAVRAPGRARHSTMRVLFEALARDPRTRGRFELDSRIASAEGPVIDVALVARAERIAVELDAWYHFHDPEGYRRDRVQDRRLSRAGYFVLRFPAEDVDDRLASTIEHLAIALVGRRAVSALI